MSGQDPQTHGMVGFLDGQEWDPPHTLAGELAGAGYQCEMIGKLHLWPKRKRYGFHHMQLADSTRAEHNDYLLWLRGPHPLDRWAMAHGVSPNGWSARPSHLDETQTHAFWCVSQAIDFVSRRDPSCPFFLNVSFIDPHPPYSPPAYYFHRYVNMDLPKPVVGDWAPPFEAPVRGLDPEGAEERYRVRLDDEPMHHCRAGYYGLISHVDNQIGRLVQYLRDAKLLDDTLILFTADHGEQLGDHNMLAKYRPFEPSSRVPFLVRPPKTWEYPREVVSEAVVGLQDVMPTLLDAAGVPVPGSCTGRSVLPLMRGEAPSAVGWREFIHGECAPGYHPEEPCHFLSDGHTKYAWYSQTGRELLFDLDEDPQELHDLMRDPGAESRAEPWRRRLIERVLVRPEGFTDGRRLIVGRPHRQMIPRTEEN
jgi:arylsulfatase A-like enzyme